MSSKIGKPVMHSAAWRISLWATLAFAFGTMLVFLFLHRFVAADIQRRSDAWLSGEVEVLGDVAEHTPKDALYGRVMGEVAELASKEVPNRVRGESAENDSVFFLQMGANGGMQLWAGPGSSDGVRRGDSAGNDSAGPAHGLERCGNGDSLSRGDAAHRWTEAACTLVFLSGMSFECLTSCGFDLFRGGCCWCAGICDCVLHDAQDAEPCAGDYVRRLRASGTRS